MADGKEESKKDGRRKRGFQLFCLSFKNQQKILNLTNVCLPGRGEGRRQQLLSSETSEPETEVSSLVFHRRRSHPLRTLSSRFRDDVVVVVFFFFCEGTANTSTENKHYSCFLSFLHLVLLHIIVFIFECV